MEIRYYISDLDDIELIAEAIRGHWEVEDYLTNVLSSFDEEMIKKAMEDVKA